MAGAAVGVGLASLINNCWCVVEVKSALGLFPYNRSYWGLALPGAAAVAATVGLRGALRSVGSDAGVLVVSLAVVYTVFLGVVLLAGLEPDDRMIADAIWAKVRGFLPGARAGARA